VIYTKDWKITLEHQSDTISSPKSFNHRKLNRETVEGNPKLSTVSLVLPWLSFPVASFPWCLPQWLRDFVSRVAATCSQRADLIRKLVCRLHELHSERSVFGVAECYGSTRDFKVALLVR
jgi:hypothetical protein